MQLPRMRQAPQYDTTMLEHHRNISVHDVQLDVPVGRIVAIGLRGAADAGPPPTQPDLNCSFLAGFELADVALLEDAPSSALRWFATTNLSAAPPGENLLCALRCDRISGVEFRNVTIGGQLVKRDTDWALDRIGNVSDVSYSYSE